MAQYNNMRRAGLVFVIIEDPPESGLHSQGGEDVCRQMQTSETLRSASARQVIGSRSIDSDIFEDSLFHPPIAEVGVGNQHFSEILPILAHPYQSIGFRIGEWT